ncbi:MAG: peptide chain release factor N(5)-glutamine methyltransferase [Leptospiraceae bacterium]|nr:peptide chain release factor N(5)-glutamine methyltransferase [Leptospiraceae bacterium]MCP5496355.1 peptide chain release factor N(5)-glutamine methyltransferase [Leptospiraceae bacterium]
MEKDTILYVIKKSEEYLKNQGIESPRLDAEVLLADMLGLERIRLYTNFDKKLNEAEKDAYRKRIKDRVTFKPIAYITNKKDFYHSTFYVDQNVLIPRPETEELIEWVLKELEKDKSYKILDLGAGSGCIGISLKKEFPDLEVVLSDISQEALDIARNNTDSILGNEVTGVSFLQSDLFNDFPPELKFDRIVSNPPYIPEDEKKDIMPDVVDFEPHQALFLSDPETFFTKMLETAKDFLKQEGIFYMETHTKWATRISELGEKFGYTNMEIKKDISGKNRMVKLCYG